MQTIMAIDVSKDKSSFCVMDSNNQFEYVK